MRIKRVISKSRKTGLYRAVARDLDTRVTTVFGDLKNIAEARFRAKQAECLLRDGSTGDGWEYLKWISLNTNSVKDVEQLVWYCAHQAPKLDCRLTLKSAAKWPDDFYLLSDGRYRRVIACACDDVDWVIGFHLIGGVMYYYTREVVGVTIENGVAIVYTLRDSGEK